MSGFKNFLLRGNLVDLAVAVIIGTAFGAVVAAFTAWLTKTVAGDGSDFFSGELGSAGFFLNAVISFVILAAVVINARAERRPDKLILPEARRLKRV